MKVLSWLFLCITLQYEVIVEIENLQEYNQIVLESGFFYILEEDDLSILELYDLIAKNFKDYS